MVTPAEPMLASTLWAGHISDQDIHGIPNKPKKVATGNRRIDTALENGPDHGIITCISSESDAGAREISQALLVSHLLSHSTSTATIIDSAFSLDVRILYSAVVGRLPGEENASKTAAKMLDRVNIMKVFDFVGLTESLSELRNTLEGSALAGEPAQEEPSPPKGTIGDSEDEDENEMLLDEFPSVPARKPVVIPPASVPHEDTGPGLLIIDNICQLVAPQLKINYVQGQALLASFMRSLSHLTKAHNLCTILINGVMAKTNVKEETPSIFSSCTLQPALGKSFTYLLDLHLLIHKAPKAADGKADEVTIVEVLHDRYGDRIGKWAPFIVEESGSLAEYNPP